MNTVTINTIKHQPLEEQKRTRSLGNVDALQFDMNVHVPNAVIAVGVVKQEVKATLVKVHLNVHRDGRVKLVGVTFLEKQ